MELRTERLVLRHWRASDRAPFAALNADAEVMRHLPSALSREESDELADRIAAALDREGFGLWALEERGSGRFLGFTGLARPTFAAPFTPAVEVGWRLARHGWGQGLASEAARAAVTFGFDVLGLGEIVSFTAAGNARSRAVMHRLGMTRDPADDFDHPRLPEGHPLRRHVLYRMSSVSRARTRRAPHRDRVPVRREAGVADEHAGDGLSLPAPAPRAVGDHAPWYRRATPPPHQPASRDWSPR